MLKKDRHFKWTLEEKEAFDKIKDVISSAPILSNFDMSKDFIMYAFSNNYNMAVVLT